MSTTPNCCQKSFPKKQNSVSLSSCLSRHSPWFLWADTRRPVLTWPRRAFPRSALTALPAHAPSVRGALDSSPQPGRTVLLHGLITLYPPHFFLALTQTPLVGWFVFLCLVTPQLR